MHGRVCDCVMILLLLSSQKIRTVELDGKTIKLQIVSESVVTIHN